MILANYSPLLVAAFLVSSSASSVLKDNSCSEPIKDTECWVRELLTGGPVLLPEPPRDFPYWQQMKMDPDSFGTRLVEMDIGDIEAPAERLVIIDRNSNVRSGSDFESSKTVLEKLQQLRKNILLQAGLRDDYSPHVPATSTERITFAIDEYASWGSVVSALAAAYQVGFTEVGFVFAQPSSLKSPDGFWTDERFLDISLLGFSRVFLRGAYYDELSGIEEEYLKNCRSSGDKRAANVKEFSRLTDLSVCGCSADLGLFKKIWWARTLRQFARPQKVKLLRISGDSDKKISVEFGEKEKWSSVFRKIFSNSKLSNEEYWVEFISRPVP